MASLYTVLPGLQPTQQEIAQAELLAIQILQPQFPDLDLREGTGLRDTVIRPTAFMLALTNKGLNYYFTQNTLAGVDNNTPQEVVDNILSNWFLTRNLGTFAVISSRLYFARQKNVSISSNVFFSPDNSLMYYPQQTISIPASAMSYDAFQNEWYVDINLQAAQQGTTYNLSSGSLLYFGTFDPYFLHAEINYLVSASIAGETNAEFIARSQTAISTRNLINNPSIISNLQQEFNYVLRCIPIGMGDPEMIRDQIKAVFDPEVPRLLTELTSTGTTATATLPDHGWFTGQLVNITGATPSGYNGQYEITVVDISTFTYTLGSPASVVTVLPSVQSYTTPLLLHNGGMIDIYCDDSQSSTIVQLTTDQNGNATLAGPVTSFSRSSISGGSADDTIPLQQTVSYSSTTIDTGAKVIHVSSTAHGLLTGTAVTLSGLTQTLSISAISCSGILVTITSTAHGLTSGTQVVVSGVTPAQYNGTFTVTVVDANTLTYNAAANIPSSGSGTMIMTNSVINNTQSITVIGPDAFDFPVPNLWTAATDSGTIVLSYDVFYTVTNPYLREQTLATLTCVGTTVTATLQNHGQTVNRYVTIEGATPSGYNGQHLITEIVNGNQFTYEVSSTLGSPATGTITCTSVVPWYDVGFSTRQLYTIGFGASYANQTASFQTDYFTNLNSVQVYLEDAANRVLSGDPLARGFNFYVLDIGITGYGSTTPSSGIVQTVTQTYLTSLQTGQVFIMSDYMAALEAAGITGIQTPASVTYKKYTRDLINPISGTITDYLDPNDRTNVFLLGTITTTSAVIVPSPTSV